MGNINNLLIYLATKGAINREIELSTAKISKDFDSSQQTISRKLIELEDSDLIQRNPSTRGIKLWITEKGTEFLATLHNKLDNIFINQSKSIKGTVQSGLGEGSYYVALPEYMKQFKEKLEINPFEGTLNVKTNYIDFINLISGKEKIIIDGFKTKDRTFGPIVAYKITVNNTNSAIVIPERTSHDREIIEIISEVSFRKKFDIADGEKVEIR